MSERATLDPPARTGAIRAEPPTAGRWRRCLGRVVGERPGPTLVVVGSLHGNEPSGVYALERVLAALQGKESALAGEFVALAGNLVALDRGVRFLDRDLNRCWTAEQVAAIRARPADAWSLEDREQIELLAELEAVFERCDAPAFILDLHSTSAGGAPFAVLNDTLPNRAFASRLPVPIVLGIEERLQGTLLTYLSDLGHVTAGFESGQHTSPYAVDHAEAAIWIALGAAGLLDPAELRPPAHLEERLQAAGNGLPRFVEAHHRHGLRAGDGFQMEPSYVNFQPVRAGQLLARDRGGEIRSPRHGLLLMPLYQPQGEDGFFLARGFSPVWLELSALLRRLRADRLVHWLPGVHRHPELPATYFVDRHVARWFAMELFHLLGFRRREEIDGRLVVTRRPHDLDLYKLRRNAG